jgi:4-amino-4-deoxy-L-arabinose transferase-like glycosyltransferase
VNAVGMWFPYAIPFYVARIGEMRPVMIVLAAVITIAILIWRKPERYALWIAGVVVGAIVLILMSDRRRVR